MDSISTSPSPTCSMDCLDIFDDTIPCGLEMFTFGDSLDFHDDTILKKDMLNMEDKTPPINPQTSSRLLLLPGELRNSIYTHLSSTSSNASSPLILSHDKLDGILSLLLVNKQLRSEVCTFLLEGRTMVLDIHARLSHVSWPLDTNKGVEETESLFSKFGRSNFLLITRFRFRAMDKGTGCAKKTHEKCWCWHQGLDVIVVPRGNVCSYEVKAFRDLFRSEGTDTPGLWTPIQLARLIEAKR